MQSLSLKEHLENEIATLNRQNDTYIQLVKALCPSILNQLTDQDFSSALTEAEGYVDIVRSIILNNQQILKLTIILDKVLKSE